MEIKTRFNEGDTIWFIHDTKAIETVVRGMKIERRPIDKADKIQQVIIYLCHKENKENLVFIKVDELIAYPTKEALIQSL